MVVTAEGLSVIENFIVENREVANFPTEHVGCRFYVFITLESSRYFQTYVGSNCVHRVLIVGADCHKYFAPLCPCFYGKFTVPVEVDVTPKRIKILPPAV